MNNIDTIEFLKTQNDRLKAENQRLREKNRQLENRKDKLQTQLHEVIDKTKAYIMNDFADIEVTGADSN